MRRPPEKSAHTPSPPFRLLFQEPRDPAPGLCGMMNARTFTQLDEAKRQAHAMMKDEARRPVQIQDADHRVLWDEYENDQS
ncbi:hypothetical protein [Ancylobacter pratisalsi]|uniref:Uncharacterized protein n=1 Tax=Ancylobacter pratisalsi TaxID=1745854 RepID=A0A6P1YK61_9HYPH|nr:hypothetical protein [Ancylobacter pratisalsi]QIB33787.1 hypothetical protein G3A50_08785 [Ancylobacter pratisalsi]